MEKESSLYIKAQLVVILLVAVLFNGPSVQAALVVPNYSGSSITFYNNSDNGNMAPWKTIAGPNTGLNGPTCSFVYNDEVYVANHNDGKVHVFSYGAEGNVAPIRTIEGSATALVNPTHCIVVNNELFLSNFRGDVLVFNATDSGNLAPKRRITSVNNNRGLTVSGNELFVARDVGSGDNTIYVFNTSDDGPAIPKRTIEGANTQISFPLGMSVNNGELFVGSVNNNAILVFNVTDSGDAPPKRIISGASTQINYPAGVWAWGGEIFVANHHGNTINVFNSTDNDNTAPKRIISGSSTGLNNPYFVAVYSCVQPPSGLVSWWGGDNNALDLIGTNHGTMMSGATFGTGKVGQAFSFDGVDDYVEIADSGNLNPATITLDAWVSPDTIIGNGPRIISKDISTTSCVYPYITYDLEIRGDAGNRARFAFATSDDIVHELLGTSVIPTGTFSHIAATFDGSTAKIYVNGVLENSLSVPGILKANSAPVVIGNAGAACRSSYSGMVEFDGLIDEVEIFNRAISADEIAAIYNAGSAGKCIPDRTPGNFIFSDVTNAERNTVYESNVIIVSGIDYATPISISGGIDSGYALSTDGGSNWSGWTNSMGTVNLNDQVKVRQSSSPNLSTSTPTTLTIGGESDTFSVTTRDAFLYLPLILKN